MAILPKAIYMFSAIPIKIPMIFITEIEKSILKFIWKHKRPQISNAILAKRAMLEVAQYLNSSYITKQSLLKTAWYWPKKRHEDQWNRIQDQYMNPHNYAHLIFDKVFKNI
jgi:hypothetical protein